MRAVGQPSPPLTGVSRGSAGADAAFEAACVQRAVVPFRALNDVPTVSAAAASDDEEAAAGGSNDVDIRRLKIIAQATTFVGPKQRKYRGDSWGRLAASHAGGISFKVLGVRWTSAYFAALLLSSGASLLSGLALMYT